jgi:hypothetical protein
MINPRDCHHDFVFSNVNRETLTAKTSAHRVDLLHPNDACCTGALGAPFDIERPEDLVGFPLLAITTATS